MVYFKYSILTNHGHINFTENLYPELADRISKVANCNFCKLFLLSVNMPKVGRLL